MAETYSKSNSFLSMVSTKLVTDLLRFLASSFNFLISSSSNLIPICERAIGLFFYKDNQFLLV